ncbi:IS3 family transposase, partial [Pseudomonas sp. HMWF006]
HSDQGCHYSSKMFRETVSEMRIKQSMSRRGNCWDTQFTMLKSVGPI